MNPLPVQPAPAKPAPAAPVRTNPAPSAPGLAPSGLAPSGLAPPDLVPDWHVSAEPVPYDQAVAAMEARVAAIHAGTARELIWLLEHPPLYTAGTSARPEDLLDARYPVHSTGRGGQYTWHGPGQRVAYVMLDVARRGRDIRHFVTRLEAWGIAALASLGVAAGRRAGRVGLWVPARPQPEGGPAEAKLAAIGVRLRHWVSFHGIAFNVDCDLSAYDGIVPCGLRGHRVTSLRALGSVATMASLDAALAHHLDSLLTPPGAPRHAIAGETVPDFSPGREPHPLLRI